MAPPWLLKLGQESRTCTNHMRQWRRTGLLPDGNQANDLTWPVQTGARMAGTRANGRHVWPRSSGATARLDGKRPGASRGGPPAACCVALLRAFAGARSGDRRAELAVVVVVVVLAVLPRSLPLFLWRWTVADQPRPLTPPSHLGVLPHLTLSPGFD